jgi:hypothetical protein
VWRQLENFRGNKRTCNTTLDNRTGFLSYQNSICAPVGHFYRYRYCVLRAKAAAATSALARTFSTTITEKHDWSGTLTITERRPMRILKAGGSGRRKMVVRVVTPGGALHTADFLITLSFSFLIGLPSCVLRSCRPTSSLLHGASQTSLSPSGLA